MSATKVQSETKPILIGVGLCVLILIAVYFFIGRSEDTISMAPAPVVTEAERVVTPEPAVVQVETLAPPLVTLGPAPAVVPVETLAPVPAPAVVPVVTLAPAPAVVPVVTLAPPLVGPSVTGPSRPATTGPSVTGPSATATVPKGRFIKLIQTVAYDENDTNNKNKIINLAELEVFDANGVNLASGKKVTGSSEYSATHGYLNLTDGNKTNFAHTNGKTIDEYDYLQVDLGALKDIKKIVITNRTTNNSVKDRAIGIKAIIYANNGTTVVKETPMITTRANTYTLTFPENVWS